MAAELEWSREWEQTHLGAPCSAPSLSPHPWDHSCQSMGACKSQAQASGALGPEQRASSPRICVPGLTCSVIQSCQTLGSHRLQHTRLPCPSPSPRACSNSCPLSQWCHPIISSSVIPFASCLQSFPASGSFPVSQLFTSGSQSIAASTSASVLPMNIQDRFPLRLPGLILFLSKELSRVFSSTTIRINLVSVQRTLKSLLQHHN